MTSFEALWKYYQVTLSKKCLRLRPSAKTADKKWINWIFSKMHPSIWKILFVLGAYEYLEKQKGKIKKCLCFYVKIF